MCEMILEQDESDIFEGLRGVGNLREDVDAVGIGIDHFPVLPSYPQGYFALICRSQISHPPAIGEFQQASLTWMQPASLWWNGPPRAWPQR